MWIIGKQIKQLYKVEPLFGQMVRHEAEIISDNPEGLDEFNTNSLAHLVLNQRSLVHMVKPRNIPSIQNSKFNAIVGGYKELVLNLSKRIAAESNSGTILYGPPGNGKTNMARFIADTCNLIFIPVCVADLVHKQVGDSERYIQNLTTII